MDKTQRLKDLQKASLDMLVLCVQADYTERSLFRTLVDSWFAFREGEPFVDAKCRPIWLNNPDPVTHLRALERLHFISDAAREILDDPPADAGEHDSSRLVKDHSVPLKELRNQFDREKPQNAEAAERILLRLYKLGLITRSEDRKLGRSSMPSGWNGSDPFARYFGIIGKIIPHD